MNSMNDEETVGVVRAVTLDDVPALIEVYNQTHLLANPILSQHDRAEFLLRIEEYRQKQVPLLALCNPSGQIKAWGGYMPMGSPWDTSRTVEMFAYPYPGPHAFPLVDALIAAARDHDKHSIIVQVQADNIAQTRFYDGLGFRRAGYLKQAIDLRWHQQQARAMALERGWDPGLERSQKWRGIVQFQLMLENCEASQPTKTVYVLPGERIVSIETFENVLEEITGQQGKSCDNHLQNLVDCLSGDYESPEEPYTIVWLDSAVAREAMGYSYTARILKERLQSLHSTTSVGRRTSLMTAIERAQLQEGLTEFDKIVQVIQQIVFAELILL